MIESDLKLEFGAVAFYNEAIRICVENKDNGSRDLLSAYSKTKKDTLTGPRRKCTRSRKSATSVISSSKPPKTTKDCCCFQQYSKPHKNGCPIQAPLGWESTNPSHPLPHSLNPRSSNPSHPFPSPLRSPADPSGSSSSLASKSATPKLDFATPCFACPAFCVATWIHSCTITRAIASPITVSRRLRFIPSTSGPSSWVICAQST